MHLEQGKTKLRNVRMVLKVVIFDDKYWLSIADDLLARWLIFHQTFSVYPQWMLVGFSMIFHWKYVTSFINTLLCNAHSCCWVSVAKYHKSRRWRYVKSFLHLFFLHKHFHDNLWGLICWMKEEGFKNHIISSKPHVHYSIESVLVCCD